MSIKISLPVDKLAELYQSWKIDGIENLKDRSEATFKKFCEYFQIEEL